MKSEPIEGELDDFLTAVLDRFKYRAMSFGRSALLAVVAMILASDQNVVTAPVWKIGLIVFVLGGFSRTNWIAVTAIAWLFVIVIAPDNLIAAAAKAAIRFMSGV
jgi:hypothetical protein